MMRRTVMILLRFSPHGSICSKYKIQEQKTPEILPKRPLQLLPALGIPQWKVGTSCPRGCASKPVNETEPKRSEQRTSIRLPRFKGWMCSSLPSHLATDQATQTPGPRCSCHAACSSARVKVQVLPLKPGHMSIHRSTP